MKILDNDFRKSLYKSLLEAGYSKDEAQKIVAVKYYSALKDNLIEDINKLKTNVENENYAFDVNVISDKLIELAKLAILVREEKDKAEG